MADSSPGNSQLGTDLAQGPARLTRAASCSPIAAVAAAISRIIVARARRRPNPAPEVTVPGQRDPVLKDASIRARSRDALAALTSGASPPAANASPLRCAEQAQFSHARARVTTLAAGHHPRRLLAPILRPRALVILTTYAVYSACQRRSTRPPAPTPRNENVRVRVP
jgi:hypothetical protein